MKLIIFRDCKTINTLSQYFMPYDIIISDAYHSLYLPYSRIRYKSKNFYEL